MMRCYVFERQNRELRCVCVCVCARSYLLFESDTELRLCDVFIRCAEDADEHVQHDDWHEEDEEAEQYIV